MGEDDKEILAHWMMRHEYATGHGDTIEDLLEELKWQIAERCERAIAVEREACAKVCDKGSEQMLHKYQREGAARCAESIRARG